MILTVSTVSLAMRKPRRQRRDARRRHPVNPKECPVNVSGVRCPVGVPSAKPIHVENAEPAEQEPAGGIVSRNVMAQGGAGASRRDPRVLV